MHTQTQTQMQLKIQTQMQLQKFNTNTKNEIESRLWQCHANSWVHRLSSVYHCHHSETCWDLLSRIIFSQIWFSSPFLMFSFLPLFASSSSLTLNLRIGRPYLNQVLAILYCGGLSAQRFGFKSGKVKLPNDLWLLHPNLPHSYFFLGSTVDFSKFQITTHWGSF